jgi:heme exporter protein B
MKPAYFLLHLKKDLRLEWRSKDAINSMLFFALLVVVMFSLAFDPTQEASRKIAGGILCAAMMFAAVSSLNQAWTRELRNQVMDALRMTPAPGTSMFLGKAIANFLFVTAVEIVLAPVFIVFYNLHALGNGWLMLLVLPLGTWALIVNGVFFAGMAIRTRVRELLLPLILLPIFIPALQWMVTSASSILTGEGNAMVGIKSLAAYDVAFTTLGMMLFEVILHAE